MIEALVHRAYRERSGLKIRYIESMLYIETIHNTSTYDLIVLICEEAVRNTSKQ